MGLRDRVSAAWGALLGSQSAEPPPTATREPAAEPSTREPERHLPYESGRRSRSSPEWAPWIRSSPFLEISPDVYARVYKQVTTVGAVVDYIASQAACLPIVFEQRDSKKTWRPIEPERGNVAFVWAHPKSRLTGAEIARDISISLSLNGNSFLIGDSGGLNLPPDMLTVLPGHRVHAVAGPGRTISKFLWGLQTGQVKEIDAMIAPGVWQVAHYRYANTEDEPNGLSPLVSASDIVGMRSDAFRLLHNIMQSGGLGVGGFRYDINELTKVLKDNERLQREEELAERFRGTDNAFRTMPILGSLKWEPMGLKPDELLIAEVSKLSVFEICMRYSLPPEAISATEQSGASSTGRALSETGTPAWERTAWQACLIPHLKLIEEVTTATLCPRFGENIRMRFDLSGVVALQPTRKAQAQIMAEGLRLGAATINDWRAAAGLPPSTDPRADELEEIVDEVEEDTTQPPADETESPERKRSRGAAFGDRPSIVKVPATRSPEDVAAERKRAHGATRRGFERAFRRRIVDPMLRAQQAAVESEVENGNLLRSASDKKQSRSSWRDVLLEAFDLDTVERIMTELAAERGQAQVDEIVKEVEFHVERTRVAAAIQKHAAEFVGNVNDTTLDALVRALEEGRASGDDLSQLTARVRDVFDDRRDNAATIARTESGRAYSIANDEAIRQVKEETGATYRKQWLTAQDDAVRPAHRALDGVVVGLDEDFVAVDDEGISHSAQYPGAFGEVGQDANCRCTVHYLEAVEGEDRAASAPPKKSRLHDLGYLDDLVAATIEHRNGVAG